MKLLILLAVVGCALAEADSDAGLFYGGLGYGYGGYGGLGYAGYAGYGGLGYSGYGHRGYPLRLDTLPATVGGGLVPTASGGLVPADEPAVAHARAAHLSLKFGHHGIYKRSADADSDAGLFYGGLGYGYGGYGGLGYAGYGGLGYAGYGYRSYPLRLDTLPATVGGGLVPTASGGLVPADEPAVAHARAAHLSLKFGHHGIYKRSADADSDAGLFYGGLGYGYGGYGGLGYAGYGGYGYAAPVADALPATVGGGLVPTASGGLVPAENHPVAGVDIPVPTGGYYGVYGGYGGVYGGLRGHLW